MNLIQNLASQAQKLPTCGHQSRWLDSTGRSRCIVCDPPDTDTKPPESFVTHSNTWDPFSDDPPPRGTHIALWDFRRQQEIAFRHERRHICRCGLNQETREPCRNGEWTRVYCGACRMTIRIE